MNQWVYNFRYSLPLVEETDQSNRHLQQEATNSVRYSVEELYFLAGVIRKFLVRSQPTNMSLGF